MTQRWQPSWDQVTKLFCVCSSCIYWLGNILLLLSLLQSLDHNLLSLILLSSSYHFLLSVHLWDLQWSPPELLFLFKLSFVAFVRTISGYVSLLITSVAQSHISIFVFILLAKSSWCRARPEYFVLTINFQEAYPRWQYENRTINSLEENVWYKLSFFCIVASKATGKENFKIFFKLPSIYYSLSFTGYNLLHRRRGLKDFEANSKKVSVFFIIRYPKTTLSKVPKQRGI